ncbi:MAG: hypothetical protein HOI95_13800 [Chromatiales bacterium]|jgi:PAS domain-containing protein|nr:hypothetical protein [Chromatiales bacterium]
MRRVLNGKAGIVVGLDYHGVMVPAAYDLVAALDMGVVAEVDLAEFRSPFVDAGLKAFLIAVTIVSVAPGLFVKVTNPLLASMGTTVERYRSLLEGRGDPIVRVSGDGMLQLVNQAFGEFVGSAVGLASGQRIIAKHGSTSLMMYLAMKTLSITIHLCGARHISTLSHPFAIQRQPS